MTKQKKRRQAAQKSDTASMTSKKKRSAKAVKPPKVDPAFEKLIMPLSTEEQAQLEQNLLADGRSRDKLVVWKGKNVLLDGHHRFKICKKHDLPYEVVEIEFEDREAAMAFIRKNQLGRRNMPPEAMSYIRGQHYNAEKNSHGGDRKGETSGKETRLKTDAALAARYKVDPKTIRNDAKFAEDVDTIANAAGDKLKNAVLRREVRLTRGQIKALAKMKPAEIKKTGKSVLEIGRMPPKRASDATGSKTPTDPAKVEKISVPTSPQELAKTLLSKLGPSVVAEVQQALAAVLADQQATTQSDKPQEAEPASQETIQASPQVVEKVE